MSIEKTKGQLHQLLLQGEDSVIALSGKWGTGKTHLWNKVKEESTDDNLKNALYVSLFGQSSIDQVKRKLIENSIPLSKERGKWIDAFQNLIDVSVKTASQYYKMLAAVKDVNLLLMAPLMLKNKVIVIDDIERKHEKLGIDEVLGFIDEYSNQHGSRFVLILNDDQLSEKYEQKTLWATFREKVIDQEIKLSTSPDEAFCIALDLVPSKYSEAIKQASVKCSLTNIRIITKIIKLINKILMCRDIAVPIQNRVVPSIVLFSAIHFRGLVDGPDFKFALNIGNPDWYMFSKEENTDPSPEEIRENNWRTLMSRLDIYGCDKFEQFLVDFLESGLLNTELVESVIEGYIAENEAMEANAAVHSFIYQLIWNHRLTEPMLLEQAKTFLNVCHLVNSFTVTKLHLTIKQQLTEGSQIAEEIIDEWINHNQTDDGSDNPFSNDIHPKIQMIFDARKDDNHTKRSVVDVVLYIYAHDGWGPSHQSILAKATADDFESAIRNTDDFKDFMYQMTKLVVNRGDYEQYFGSAVDHFIEACRTIINDPNSTRLATVIKGIFESRNIEVEPQQN
ncbi:MULTISPECIES: KAP family NTPase [unclassified Shewanella]|uniref:KAP family NTPase n=1 Tax=unclassified Shewanella TaxID=196818 RepID=UPI0021D9BD64|nr:MULTISPECIES: KAP family NTPase [unclassified Shewanella]MCU8034658.1 KAP family NTPase [Shewanella sp. SM71]MCU8096365.1 KAP family NTPase [Shewanella sp. SM102]